MNRRVGVNASTGILSLMMMLEQYCPKEMFVSGFSFYTQGVKPLQRHNPGYIKWGGDADSNDVIHKLDRLSQTAPHNQKPQMDYFKKLFRSYGKKLKIDSYMKELLEADHPYVEVLPDAVAVNLSAPSSIPLTGCSCSGLISLSVTYGSAPSRALRSASPVAP